MPWHLFLLNVCSLTNLVVVTKIIAVFLFAGKLACPFVKENEQFSNKSQLELEVKCLDNGDYAPLQCFTKNKTCNCVLPDGTQITQPSIRRKYCKCTLEKYNVEMKLNVNGSPIDRKNYFGGGTNKIFLLRRQ